MLHTFQLKILKAGLLCLLSLLLLILPSAAGWKAGVARVNITPDKNIWLAGFAIRNHPSEGKMHDLWVKALVMEDESGKRVVMVTADLLGFPRKIADQIRDQLKAKYGLQRDQIMLNSSHTHSGPVLEGALSDVYMIGQDQAELIKQYSKELESKIVTMVGKAIGNLEPVALFAQNGVTRFQVNRRNNNAGTLPWVSDLNGPNDYAVPVIKAVDAKGKVKAIAFGYACHPTVLDGYKFSGDYPGFAMLELEKLYPDATALFFQGAGADQNPLPRGTEQLAKQYGKELAAAVERVVEENMRKLPSKVTTAYSEVRLPFAALPDEAQLRKLMETSAVAYQKRWAERMLAKVKRGEAREKDYPYPVEVWQLGDQLIIGLGGELVIEYSIKLKEIFGIETFVAGYCNDVMTYIPSSRILGEGGYEGATACMVYGLPAIWGPDTETLILNEVIIVAKNARH